MLSVATINWGTQLQTIAGFGASSAWFLGNVDVAQQQLLWSPTNGGGLSILRNHINPDTSSSTGETGTMQKAQQMGVTIFSTPWSPPAQWKTNNNVADIVNNVQTNGTLLSGVDPSSSSGLTYYQEYANWLTQYVINMHNQGITIYAVSMQNEPNWQASYESCIYSPQQFHDILSVLENTLAGNTSTYPLSTYPYLANVKIILPEEIHWNNLDLVSQVMSDSVESNYPNIIYADHTYGINTVNNSVYPGEDGYAPMSSLYPSALNPGMNLNGHQVWETEHTGTDPSVGIQAALDEATSIYDIVYIAQASGYCHWWIWPPNTTSLGGGASLVGGNWQWTKDFSGMANYSKFIRPGWVAVGEGDDNVSGLRISAFKNPATGDFATVLINSSTSPITETINLNGAYAPVLTPWVTSATLDVAQQQSIPATGNGGSYTYTIPAKSIVTLTGNATATAVTQAPVGLLATAATTNSITLSWTNNVTSATGYTVQRSTDGTSWTTLTSTLSPSTFTYTDSSMPANSFTTTYYYRVQANGGTLCSNVVAAMTQPPAPTNLTASYNASNQTVTLTFTKNGLSTTDYAVDVSTDNGVTWTTQTASISSGSGSVNYTDTSAPELATLQYRVRAIYGANSSAPTSVVKVTTTVLKAPTGLAIAQNAASLVLTWTDNTSTNSTVSIERSTDGTNWTVLASVNHGVQTYTDSSVTEGVTYYYRIRNYDSAATPPTYSAYDTAAAFTMPPLAPTHVEVVFSPSPTLMARVLWIDNSTKNTGYEVDRSTDGGTTWKTLTTSLPASATSYTDATVTSGQAYEYRVEALLNASPSATVATLSETASALPSPYAHGDIGDAATVGLAGSASYNATTSTYTLSGSGADIWNTADGFQFAYTTLTGNSQITARVASLSNTNSWAKAGLMFRNGTTVDAAFADVVATPGNGVSFQWRTTAGGTPGYAQVTGVSAPVWLRLTRAGNQFSAYYSSDNVTWTQIGGSTTISMGTTSYVGMVACAHDSTQLATATFTNVALTGTGNQAPTVATAATASQSPPPNAATANLSVLGADDAGEANLIYSWVTSGTPPAPVVFSTNGQNASKNTIATFTKPGSYSFVVTIIDQFGLSITSAVNLTVIQATNSVVVSPIGATVAPNGQKQFTATAYDQFGTAVSSQPTFVWSTSNSYLGSVNAATGLYSAASLQGIATITATAGAVSGSASVNVTSLPAPLAWYRFDEGSGTTALDSSGNGRNATLSGSAAFGPGVSGNALALAGGYASLPTGIVSTVSNFAIAAWVNVSTLANWARIFDFGTGTTVNMYLIPDAGGTNAIRFAITTSGSGGEQRLDGPAMSANTWTHIAVTLSGNTGTLFVNGVAVATNTGMTLHPSSLGNTNQNYLGKSQYSDPALQGSIDDLRIYNTGLTSSQVTQLYDSYFPPTLSSAATANPTTVTATTSALSALGASSVKLPLTYTWSAIGAPPAPVTFSPNGTGAAASTVATFSKAGTYTLVVMITDTYGQFTTSSVTVNVQQTLTGLVVSPSPANITAGGSQQFTATANDQFGQPMATQPTMTWTLVSGLGNLTTSGLYTPPYANSSATVMASSGSLANSALVTYATQAQWNAAASDSWSGGGNWEDALTSSTISAPGIGTRSSLGDIVTFAAALGPIARLDGDSPTLAGITFNNSATSYTIAQGSGGSLTLQSAGGAMLSVLAGNHAISAPLHLLSNTTVNAAAASTLTMTGTIDGKCSLTKTGSGTLVLNVVNSFSGGLIVQSGTVQIDIPGALPDGSSLTVGGGSFSSAPPVDAASAVPTVSPTTAALGPAVAETASPSPETAHFSVSSGKASPVGAHAGAFGFPTAVGLRVGGSAGSRAAVAAKYALAVANRVAASAGWLLRVGQTDGTGSDDVGLDSNYETRIRDLILAEYAH